MSNNEDLAMNSDDSDVIIWLFIDSSRTACAVREAFRISSVTNVTSSRPAVSGVP